MRKLYYRILRDIAAIKIMASLVANPERYKYIAEKIDKGELDNHSATVKNVNKSIIIADRLIGELRMSKKVGS